MQEGSPNIKVQTKLLPNDWGKRCTIICRVVLLIEYQILKLEHQCILNLRKNQCKEKISTLVVEMQQNK